MIRKAALPALAVVGLTAAALAIVLFVTRGSSTEPLASHTAAIVDQLGFTAPAPAFVAEATRALEQAGYTVDYFPSEQVTVDFYRELPARGYGLVIVRAHSGFAAKDASTLAAELASREGDTFLFSSEPYSEDKYTQEQIDQRLGVAAYLDPTGVPGDPEALLAAFNSAPRYFGIKPSFIQSSTHGRFERATVILMGCYGLSSNALAKAFVKKGAQAVVGWDDLVSAGHTDTTTERLLTHLLADNLPVDAAVAQTAAESGPDPTYGGKLTLYR